MRRILVQLLLVALAAQQAVAQAPAGIPAADREAVGALIARQVAAARRAWEVHDASLMIPDSAGHPVVRTPDGRVITAGDLRADLQRRMDMTTRVDTMVERLDSIRVIRPDSVLAYSTQTIAPYCREGP